MSDVYRNRALRYSHLALKDPERFMRGVNNKETKGKNALLNYLGLLELALRLRKASGTQLSRNVMRQILYLTKRTL